MFHRAHMPSLDGATGWLDSEPPAPAETYLDYGRSEQLASPDDAAFDERHAYELPEGLRFNHWALAGEWAIGRLYQLVRPGDVVRERTLEITFLEPGAEAYAFTLG